ncbi:hypothetical protein FRC08_010173 [Ceratobasidium sp. 394]|nr:hypothetical protein FRC08_010173 [Ceratobasidium sp. 394]
MNRPVTTCGRRLPRLTEHSQTPAPLRTAVEGAGLPNSRTTPVPYRRGRQDPNPPPQHEAVERVPAEKATTGAGRANERDREPRGRLGAPTPEEQAIPVVACNRQRTGTGHSGGRAATAKIGC